MSDGFLFFFLLCRAFVYLWILLHIEVLYGQCLSHFIRWFSNCVTSALRNRLNNGQKWLSLKKKFVDLFDKELLFETLKTLKWSHKHVITMKKCVFFFCCKTFFFSISIFHICKYVESILKPVTYKYFKILENIFVESF